MTDHEGKAREIVTRLLLAAPEITCARGRRSFECDEEKAVSAIASALREAEAGERERRKRVNADIIAMVISENPDASPAYLAVQICERIENA